MNSNNYVIKSLEMHLFFGRIMKEHAFFLRAGFTPANASFSRKADYFMREFEKALLQAIALGNGIVSEEVLRSDEVVTSFTSLAEKQTERFTSIPINKSITEKELQMRSNTSNNRDKLCTQRLARVKQLNCRILRLLKSFISFKENILNNVLECKMFTANYPLLIEHITREAKLYCECLEKLEKDGELSNISMRDIECFWNRIMMEHAMFIRGLLDPSETELFDTADEFAKEFSALLEQSRNAHNRTLTINSLEETIKLREFKAAGTKGIQQCKIRSIILPLLADHVLREANHYIRLLKC